MDCLRCEQLVQRYLDHDLGPVHRALVEEHAACCCACAGVLAAYGGVFEALASLGREPAPPDLAAAVLARIDPRAFCPTPRERFLRLLTHPEDTLPGPAQMGVATTAIVVLLAGAKAWLGNLAAPLLESLGGAATWMYAWATGILAETWVRALGGQWPIIRQTLSTLANATKLCLDPHRSAFALMALATAAVMALALTWFWARGARGGGHASSPLV